jgi:hypothetical protein
MTCLVLRIFRQVGTSGPQLRYRTKYREERYTVHVRGTKQLGNLEILEVTHALPQVSLLILLISPVALVEWPRRLDVPMYQINTKLQPDSVRMYLAKDCSTDVRILD